MQQQWLLSIYFHFHCSRMRSTFCCRRSWGYSIGSLYNSLALSSYSVRVSTRNKSCLHFSWGKLRYRLFCTERAAGICRGLRGSFSKRPRRQKTSATSGERRLLAFSSKMALASMAESKTTICVLVRKPAQEFDLETVDYIIQLFGHFFTGSHCVARDWVPDW